MRDNTQMASSKEPHNEVKSPEVSAKDKVADREQYTDVSTNGETSKNNRETGMRGYTPQNRRYHSYQERHRNFRTKRYVPVKRCYVCQSIYHFANECPHNIRDRHRKKEENQSKQHSEVQNSFQSVDGTPQSPRDMETEENESDRGPEENMAIQNYSIADCIKRIMRLNGPTAYDDTAELTLIQMIDSRIEFHLKNFIALNREEDQNDERKSESEEILDDTDKEVFVPSNETPNSVMPRPKESIETTPLQTKQMMNDNEEAKGEGAEPDNLETPIATAWE